MDTPADRLVYAREKIAKIPSMAEAARRLHIEYQTYVCYENGTRRFDDHMQNFARMLKVNLNWLAWGAGKPTGLTLEDRILKLPSPDRRYIETTIDALEQKNT